MSPLRERPSAAIEEPWGWIRVCYIDIDFMDDDNLEEEEDEYVPPQFRILDLNDTPSDFDLEVPNLSNPAVLIQSTRFPLPNIMPEKDFLVLINSLNDKQRKYLLNLVNLVKTNPCEQFLHFISGGAGVGKSNLINAIKQVLQRYWVHQPDGKPDDIRILPIAPTGKAATGINGTTIDSAFSLGFNVKDKLRIGRVLNSDNRNTLACTISKLKLIILDEIKDMDPTAVTLYYKNADVDDFNKIFIHRSPNPTIISTAIDSCSGTGSKNAKHYMLSEATRVSHKQTQNLKYELLLCNETKYIVCVNIAVPDGISNGSSCVLKAIIIGALQERGKDTGRQAPIRVYVQFPDAKTGEKRRERLRDFSQLQVTRNQLPILPSNAQTIHCSQSCTHQKIVVYVNGLSRKLLYTAISRVTSLRGLYIVGTYKPPDEATIHNDPALNEILRMKIESQ
ncbi:ATP-dependent DNA helicase PIF4 [Frankliniella fusca]|uniref:ATP-dependent DNA helicase n=1 Tax=Frankliniella fusca TaxID=407009 RepID=A0AAE1HM45_9NEOP|nr:ATP-dependent DNA helicase PIF4 [Frankliniella fusca]